MLEQSVLTGSLGLRIQWFRARERYRRWDEELHWLQREASSTILDFEHRRKTWLSRAEDSERQGWKAYAARQASMWRLLLKEASKTCAAIFEVGHYLCDVITAYISPRIHLVLPSPPVYVLRSSLGP